jgi:hypothetical protein
LLEDLPAKGKLVDDAVPHSLGGVPGVESLPATSNFTTFDFTLHFPKN